MTIFVVGSPPRKRIPTSLISSPVYLVPICICICVVHNRFEYDAHSIDMQTMIVAMILYAAGSSMAR